MTGAPAFVSNERHDILAANQLGRALYHDLYAMPARPVNTARYVFLGEGARVFFRDWELVAAESVAVLRWASGRDPQDRDLADLITELSEGSEVFRTRWAAHNVRSHDTGSKRFHHPVVGELTLTFETMTLVADSELTMFVYTAEPGSKSEESLSLLASWAATPETVTEGA
jgi:MmyB-like transcription regulator ligand binding domain